MAVKSKTSPNGATPEAPPAIRLKRLDRVVYEVPIRGTAPLIVHRFSEKQKQVMLEAQQTKTRAKKEPKDPVALYEAARHRMTDGRDGFPAPAFKAAITHGTRLFDGITQVLVKQTVIVIGEGPEQLVPIEVDGEPRMREDAVRNASGVADLRYRPEYWPWTATLRIRTVAGQFDEETIYALVDAGGIGGIGEWRPTAPKSATGTYGTFEVVA